MTYVPRKAATVEFHRDMDLYKWLQETAERESRSVSAQIRHIARQAMQAEQSA